MWDHEPGTWISSTDHFVRRLARVAIAAGVGSALLYIALSFYFSAGWDALILWFFASAQALPVVGGLIFAGLYAFPGLSARPWVRGTVMVFAVLWAIVSVVTLLGPPTLITAALTFG